MASFEQYQVSHDVKAQAEELGFDMEVIFSGGTRDEMTKFYKHIKRPLTPFEAERTCMELNGTLPIIHDTNDLINLRDQLDYEAKRVLTGMSFYKDNDNKFIIQWPDGYRVFQGENYDDLNDDSCKEKFVPSDENFFYGAGFGGKWSLVVVVSKN